MLIKVTAPSVFTNVISCASISALSMADFFRCCCCLCRPLRAARLSVLSDELQSLCHSCEVTMVHTKESIDSPVPVPSSRVSESASSSTHARGYSWLRDSSMRAPHGLCCACATLRWPCIATASQPQGRCDDTHHVDAAVLLRAALLSSVAQRLQQTKVCPWVTPRQQQHHLLHHHHHHRCLGPRILLAVTARRW